MQKLKNCSTPNSDCKEMKMFLNSNKNLVFVEIDKSKNVGLLDLDDYCHKLISVFGTDKFEKLSRNPCEVDIEKIFKLIIKCTLFQPLTIFG